MPRYRSRSLQSPAEKNYVISSQDGIASGTSSNVIVANCNDGNLDQDVKIPCRIKAVYIMSAMAAEFISTTSSLAAACLIKDVGGSSFAALNPNAALSNVTQNQMIYWYRMLNGRSADTPTRHIGWIKIPKRHQIFNEGDLLRWVMNCSNPDTATWEHCSNFVYKYRQ